MPGILIDTGAIRALLDPGDKYHGEAVFNDFETYRLPGRLKFDILFTRR